RRTPSAKQPCGRCYHAPPSRTSGRPGTESRFDHGGAPGGALAEVMREHEGMDVFEEIADERRTVADMAAGLSPEQLATPSLCTQWTVREVVAHLLMPLE